MIRPERKPPPLPRYDHEHPQTCFDPVIDLLQSMLAAVFDRSAVQLPLESAGPGPMCRRSPIMGFTRTVILSGGGLGLSAR
jgi:predicted component of type VI protein secretion system